MNRWYVARTHPKAERKALENLIRQGFHAYLPLYGKPRRHARRSEVVPAPLFPRYLFIDLDLTRCRWRSILSTIGVSQLVSAGDRPVPVPEGIVEEIRGSEGENGMVDVAAELPFAEGDMVQITAGPMRKQTGLFRGLSDRDRVFVLLDLLGRQVTVQVPTGAVAAYV